MKYSKEEIIQIIINLIKEKKDYSVYSSINKLTSYHKISAYSAIENILKSEPDNMIMYLLSNYRGGFQSKIFQEYVNILEAKLPFSYIHKKEEIIVKSLLDLNIFDGISNFNSIIPDSLEIKNGTKEYYIGSRKAYYTRNFYIGKILEIIDIDSKISLINNIDYYTFLKIKFKDVKPGLKISISHLRVPPHYQIKGMSYINRALKDIKDNIKIQV